MRREVPSLSRLVVPHDNGVSEGLWGYYPVLQYRRSRLFPQQSGPCADQQLKEARPVVYDIERLQLLHLEDVLG